ncbi:hypothetical protein L842_0824 [Mycobacterium intracellulare MIN_052511_1280]|nr:hypothetical protein L842_0824 [Mycobacterium intracellulare MIN_052511_1280]
MHARRALAAAEEPLDQLDRAASIGTSVELLAKAALTLISPTLIAEKDPRTLLMYSGVQVPGMSAHEAKTKLVGDCLLILKHSHSVNFNPQADQKVLTVRNLALHSGQVDNTAFNEALTIMTRLNEEILGVIAAHDATLDRATFWGADLLAQVDERLKEVQQARMLALEELKAAARRIFDRLTQMGFSDDALLELADRDPGIDDPAMSSAPDYDPERRECPACGYNGWLGYGVTHRGTMYTETDDIGHDAWHLVDVTIEARQFACGVCRLALPADLLDLEGMDDVRDITLEATQEEIDAREQYEIDSYLEDEYRRRQEEAGTVEAPDRDNLELRPSALPGR